LFETESYRRFQEKVKEASKYLASEIQAKEATFSAYLESAGITAASETTSKLQKLEGEVILSEQTLNAAQERRDRASAELQASRLVDEAIRERCQAENQVKEFQRQKDLLAPKLGILERAKKALPLAEFERAFKDAQATLSKLSQDLSQASSREEAF